MEFDWTGVVVRHFLVLGRRRGGLYRCVSRCGVRVTVNAASLEGGMAAACEACATDAQVAFGLIPPGDRTDTKQGRGRLRVALGGELGHYLLRFEERNMIETELRNLRGESTRRDWADNAAPLLRELVTRSGLGPDFGWKAFVRDCHAARGHAGAARHPVKVVGNEAGQRRVVLKVSPGGGAYTYDVDLHTGRDVSWQTVVAKLTGAAEAMVAGRAADVPPGGPPPAPAGSQPPDPTPDPAPAPGSGHALGMGIGQLEGLRRNLDRVIAVARDAQASEQLVAELTAAEAEARAVAEPFAAEAERAGRAAEAAVAAARDAAARVEELRRSLAAAEATHADAARRAADAAGDADVAARVAAPAVKAWDDARAALAEAEAAEAERVASIGKAADLAGLLQALAKLGG